MYITLTGKLGSGKSTVAKIIRDRYGFEIYSTGTIQRGIAEKMGISTLELNQLMRTDPKYDDLIDNETVRISEEREGDNILFDSRMAFHFVKESFKVFAYVSPYESAKRVMGDSAARGSVEQYKDIEDARDQLLKRSEVENIRFREMYHLNNLDYDNYNLIIDTTWCTPEEIVAEIMKGFEEYKADPSMKRVAISPKSLYPMVDLSELDPAKITLAKEAFEKGEKPAQQVKVVLHDHLHYCVEGMEVVAAALERKKEYVSGSFGKDSDDFVPGKFDREAYEKLGDFCYKD